MERKVDGETLRKVMRRVPSPVTVVTAASEHEMRGITIGSFTSVSLDPPLVCFNVAKDAQMHDLIVEVDHFAVHVLSERQAYLSDHFAVPDRSGEEQFASVSYRIDRHGLPVLNNVLAVLYCRRHAVYPAGDHSLVVGELVDVEEVSEGKPILYYERTYRSVGDEVTFSLFSPVKRVSNETP